MKWVILFIVILILFITGKTMSQRHENKGFIGLNNTANDTLIPDEALSDCQDIRILDDMSMRTRTGYSKVVTAAESNDILDIEQIEIAQNKYEFFVTKNDIKQVSGSTSSSVYSSLSGFDQAKIMQFNRKLFVSNGVNNVKKLAIKNNNFILATDGANHKIHKLDGEGNYITSYGSSGSGDYQLSTPKGIATDNEFIYVCDSGNGKVKKFTLDFDFIDEVALAGCTGIAVEGGNAYVTASNNLYKYDTATLTLSTSTAISDLQEKCICANSSYLFVATSSGPSSYDSVVSQRSLTNLAESDSVRLSGLQAIQFMTCDSTTIYINSNQITDVNYIYTVTISTMVQGSTIFSGSQIPPSINSTDPIAINNNNLVLSKVTMDINANTSGFIFLTTDGTVQKELSDPIAAFDMTYLAVSQNDFTNWYDLCSPYRPIAYIQSTSGSVNATVLYKYTFHYTDGYTTLESSGGLASSSLTASSDKVEVILDFQESTWINYNKADTMLANHFKVYRSDDAADYKLQGTYPIYWQLNGAISSSDGSFDVQSNSLLSMTNVSADTFYVAIDDELIAVTAVSDNTWTVTRAQKGTTAAAHKDSSYVYLYSFLDDTADVSGNAVCPIQNDYTPKAKYMTTHQGTLILANSDLNPSYIWFASYNANVPDEDILFTLNSDGTTTDNKYPVFVDDGYEITGVWSYDEKLFVFKEHATYNVVGDLTATDNIPAVIPFNNIGLMSPHSLREVYGGLMGLSYEGIFFIYGTQTIILSRRWIQGTIDTINWDYAYKAVGVFYPKRHEYWLSVPTGSSTSNDTTIVLKCDLSDLSKEEGIKSFYIFSLNLTAAEQIRDSSNDIVIWTGDTDKLLCLQDDTEADNGSAITAYAITKNRNFNVPYHKKFRMITVDYNDISDGVLEVDYSVDNGSYSDGSVTLTNTSKRMHDTASIHAQGRYMKIRYRCNTASDPFQIFNDKVDYKRGRIRK